MSDVVNGDKNKRVTITGGKNLNKFIDKLKNQSSSVEVGFFDSELASIAIYNEYGTTLNGKPHIPPRTFMQNAIDQDAKDWQNVFGNNIVKNKYDIGKTMADLGATIKNSIQDSIKNGQYVDNAPATIAKKGINKPLIDSGLMLQSVTFEVEK